MSTEATTSSIRRGGQRELDAGQIKDNKGHLRLVFRAPTWDDYLALAFDEIRQFGANSVQVMRRLRWALIAVAEPLTNSDQADAVLQYLKHLDLVNRPLVI